MYISLEEAIYKCSGRSCMFPYRNFKFKNYTDKTVYRYKILSTEEVPETGNECNLSDFIQTTPKKMNLGINSSITPSPTKPIAKNASTEKSLDMNFDFLDIASPATINRISHSDAMEELQSQLDNILSSHCNVLDSVENSIEPLHTISPTSVKSGSPKSSPKIEKSKPKSVPVKKLTKCFDFLEQKAGVKSSIRTDIIDPFKVPLTPGKQPTQSINHYNHKQKRHKHKHHHHYHSRAEIKQESSPEKINNASRLYALEYLKHYEIFKSETSKKPIFFELGQVPVDIEISPQINCYETEIYPLNIQIKEENP